MPTPSLGSCGGIVDIHRRLSRYVSSANARIVFPVVYRQNSVDSTRWNAWVRASGFARRGGSFSTLSRKSSVAVWVEWGDDAVGGCVDWIFWCRASSLISCRQQTGLSTRFGRISVARRFAFGSRCVTVMEHGADGSNVVHLLPVTGVLANHILPRSGDGAHADSCSAACWGGASRPSNVLLTASRMRDGHRVRSFCCRMAVCRIWAANRDANCRPH